MPGAKNPGVAAILSFFWCGAGQIYNGRIGKGIILGVCYGISLLLVFVLIGLLTTPILWAYGMIDAYRTAEAINRDLTGPQKRCPHCAELIQAEAAVCRYCGRDVSAVH